MKLQKAFLILMVLSTLPLRAAVAGDQEKEINLADLAEDKKVQLQNLNPLAQEGSAHDDRSRQTLLTGYFVGSYRWGNNGYNHAHGNELHFAQDKPNTREFRADLMEVGFTHRFSQYVWTAASMEIGTHQKDVVDSHGSLNTEVQLHQGEVSLMAPIGNGIIFTVGKLKSPVSFEQEDAVFMLQASHSLTYQYASPSLVTGLMVSYPIALNLDIHAMVFNGWAPDGDVNSEKSMLLQTTWAPFYWLNTKISYIRGAENTNGNDLREVWDTSSTITPFKGWIFGTEFAYGKDYNGGSLGPRKNAEWLSGQLTAHHDINSWLGVTSRYSVFDDQDGRNDIHPGKKRTMNEFSFTPTIHLNPNIMGYMGLGMIPWTQHMMSGIDLRFEYRRDWNNEGGSSRTLFIDRGGNPVVNRDMFIAQLVGRF